MANIFEQLMAQNRELSEAPVVKESVDKLRVPVTKIRLESLEVLENKSLEETDQMFELPGQEALDNPEETKDIVVIVDPELPADGDAKDVDMEKAAEELIDQKLYKCPVCGGNYVCKGECKTDEEGKPTECPICGDDSVQIEVGVIAPMDSVKPEDEVGADSEDNEEEKEEEIEEESEEESDGEKKEEEKEEEVIEDSVNREEASAETVTENVETAPVEEAVVTEEVVTEERANASQDATIKAAAAAAKEIAKAEVKGQAAGKATTLNRELADDNLAVIPEKDEHGETEFNVVRRDSDEAKAAAAKNAEEKAESIEIEGKCKCHGKDCDCPECKAAKKPKKEIDEECLESLMNEFLDENYKGAVSCEFTDASFTKDGQLALEYVVYRGNKAIDKGRMVSEGHVKRTTSFLDESCTFSESSKRPAFTFEFVREGNKIIPTNLKYNFIKQINESVYRVTGEHSI